MSIYTTVKDRLPEATPVIRPRTATLVAAANGDPQHNDPALGIVYQCDFRCEEESGATEIARAVLNAADPASFFAREAARRRDPEAGSAVTQGRVTQAQLVHSDKDVVVFSTRPRGAYPHELATAKKYLADRTVADEHEPLLHPGWFHTGRCLVLPRTHDVFGEVLELLVDAARDGSLAVGGGTGGIGAGFSLFDERDISEEKRAQVAAANDERAEDLAALAPAAEAVKAKHGYYALGSPRRQDGVTRYWLNGSGVALSDGRQAQPFGWYTVEELLAEKYIADMEEREGASVR